MNSSQLILDFESLSHEKQIVLLCSVSLRLTILVRIYGVEIVNKKELIEKILRMNEIQHKLLGYMGHIMLPSESCHSVGDFLRSVKALSEKKDIDTDFVAAWQFAMRIASEDH